MQPQAAQFSDAERELVIKGLQALRRERGFAWNVACDVAARSNVTVSPSLSLYGITEIELGSLRLQIVGF
ncbi:hypothetical protein [Pseudomonas savastanoi]|uniref:hypothetical protein n=1 Tax=Pseudomonas savastanoi TaxID=29438 RepID=UPI0034E4D68F